MRRAAPRIGESILLLRIGRSDLTEDGICERRHIDATRFHLISRHAREGRAKSVISSPIFCVFLSG